MAAGVLLAPLAILLPAFLYVAVLEPGLSSAPGYEFRFAEVVTYLRPAVIIAYAGILVVGLPAHFILRSRGRVELRDYAIAGACLVVVPLVGLLGWIALNQLRGDGLQVDGDFIGHLLLESVIDIAAGALVASAFWFVSVRK